MVPRFSCTVGCLCKALSSDIATAVQAEVKEANRGMVDSSRSTAASLKAMQKDVGRMVAAMEKSAAKCRCTVFATAIGWVRSYAGTIDTKDGMSHPGTFQQPPYNRILIVALQIVVCAHLCVVYRLIQNIFGTYQCIAS